MTRTLNVNEINNSIQAVLALTKNGDEVVLEENGNLVAKVTPIGTVEKPENLPPRIAGLREGRSWMSDDFDDELPDEFWGFDKEL